MSRGPRTARQAIRLSPQNDRWRHLGKSFTPLQTTRLQSPQNNGALHRLNFAGKESPMIEDFLHRPWVVAQLRASAFGPDLDALTDELQRIGYTVSTRSEEHTS